MNIDDIMALADDYALTAGSVAVQPRESLRAAIQAALDEAREEGRHGPIVGDWRTAAISYLRGAAEDIATKYQNVPHMLPGADIISRIADELEAMQQASPYGLDCVRPICDQGLAHEVDAWFSRNTGLGGCSDKDVLELSAIFNKHQQKAISEARAEERERCAKVCEIFEALDESAMEHCAAEIRERTDTMTTDELMEISGLDETQYRYRELRTAIQSALDEATAAERERCIAICLKYSADQDLSKDHAYGCAVAIRKEPTP